jgi:hypothetical protein
VPQYIQDWDASNNYALLSWIDGVCVMLQDVDNYSRDTATDVGWARLFKYTMYQDVSDYETTLDALQVLPWFAQFVGTRLPEIPLITYNSTKDFIDYVKPYINDWLVQLKNYNGFQRGSYSAFMFLFANYISGVNIGNNNVTLPIDKSNIQILEQTNICLHSEFLRMVYDQPADLIVVSGACGVCSQQHLRNGVQCK